MSLQLRGPDEQSVQRERRITSSLKAMVSGRRRVNRSVRQPAKRTPGISTISNRNFILFRSELFLHEQSHDQIDRWFVGGDCVGWIYARLLPLPNIVRETEPVMEDSGWFASVRTRDTETSVRLLVYAWDYLDHCWLIGLDPKSRLLRRQRETTIRAAINCVADGIDGIIGSDDRFESFGWREQNPFDSGVTDPRR